MPGLESRELTRTFAIRKIRELLTTAAFFDNTLAEELTQLLADLTAGLGRGEVISAEVQDRVARLELLLSQLQVRVQRQNEAAARVSRWGENTVTLPPKAFIEMLKRSGSLAAQQAAEELERLLRLLTELMQGRFRGASAERIRRYARELQAELLGVKEGEAKSYWRGLLEFGAGKGVEAIERDPKGSALRSLIAAEAIDLDEIVATVRRLLQRAEATASRRFLVDIERQLNEGLLEYMVPREKRDPDDPFIRRFAKYINPNTVLTSRLVTPFEKSLQQRSLNLLKVVLQIFDEIVDIISSIKAQVQEEGVFERKLQRQEGLVDHLLTTTDSINTARYQDEATTEAAYLSLVLRWYGLGELKERLAMFQIKLGEDARIKLLVGFLKRKILRYTQELIEYTKQERLRELQQGINELRNALQTVGARFSLEHEVTALVEALQPNYTLLFQQEAPEDFKHFLGVNKALKKSAKKLKKVATKEKSPESAWKTLQAQMEGLQKEIRAR